MQLPAHPICTGHYPQIDSAPMQEMTLRGTAHGKILHHSGASNCFLPNSLRYCKNFRHEGKIHHPVSEISQSSTNSSVTILLPLGNNLSSKPLFKEDKFQFAGFGRETLAYPDLAADICRTGELDQKRLCITCGKCTEIMRQKGGTPGCVVRDSEVYAPIYRELCLKK